MRYKNPHSGEELDEVPTTIDSKNPYLGEKIDEIQKSSFR